MKVVLIVNSGAGKLAVERSKEQASEILAACRSHEIDATTELCEPARLTATAKRLAEQGFDAVVAVGGDGTVSAVAAGIVGTNVPLGVLPLGTLNHFSKDLGIVDLDAAFDTIATGRPARVDVGEVNGRMFINNSSIGVYPEFIVQRDRDRHRTGARRWFSAILGAARRVVSDELEVMISVPGHVTSALTPFVFIGNNAYARDLFALGRRERLDGGRLSVYTMHATSRIQLFRALLQAIFRGRKPPELEEHNVEHVVIATPKRYLKVAVDGEVVRMESPLEYRIRPAALVVLAPADENRRIEESRTFNSASATPRSPALRSMS